MATVAIEDGYGYFAKGLISATITNAGGTPTTTGDYITSDVIVKARVTKIEEDYLNEGINQIPLYNSSSVSEIVPWIVNMGMVATAYTFSGHLKDFSGGDSRETQRYNLKNLCSAIEGAEDKRTISFVHRKCLGSAPDTVGAIRANVAIVKYKNTDDAAQPKKYGIIVLMKYGDSIL